MQDLDASESGDTWKTAGAFVPGEDAWQNVPYLNWNRNNRTVNLNANWADNANPNYSVPVVRDCSAKKPPL